jgi:hypothetical protein
VIQVVIIMEMIPPCWKLEPVDPLKDNWCNICKHSANPRKEGKCSKKTPKANKNVIQNLQWNLADHHSHHDVDHVDHTERLKDQRRDSLVQRTAARAERNDKITEGVGSNSNRQSVAGEFHTRLCST